MARNLTRNTKLYVSNQSVLASCTDLNTWEIKIMDGYSFSQATTTEDITIDEAGTSPIRGQKTFNVAQDPVDVSLSTYMRPYENANTVIDAPERILWASLAGSIATVVDGNGNHTVGTPGNGSAVLQSAPDMSVDFEESDSNTLAPLTMWFNLENSTYRVDNVNLSTGDIDFAIDGIAMIAWSGFGTAVTELSAADHTTVNNFAGGVGGAGDFRAVPATSASSFLRNKLSTLSLVDNTVSASIQSGTTAGTHSSNTVSDTGATFVSDGFISIGDYIRITPNGETRVIASFTETEITIEGTWTTTPVNAQAYTAHGALTHAGVSYALAITGGSLGIENNMTFLTPEELGVVNQPLSGFAGSRAVTGTVTAYLDTGFYGTAALLQDMLDDISSVTTSYSMVLSIGGTSVATKRVDLILGTTQISVPSINVEDVIATEITFAGQGSSGLIENRDELVVKYYST